MTWRLALPLWSKIVVWGAMVVACVEGAHGVPLKIAAGVLMALAAVGVHVTNRPLPDTAQAWVAAAACGLGIATVILAPNGVGEVPMFLAVARFPFGFDSRIGIAFTVAASLGVAGTIAWLSSSPAGALAGFGVPMLVQRSMDHRALVAERDRAQALLAELQAGREAEAQAAALQERSRIARDMHDVLAHSLAGLSLQLQAARTVAAQQGDVLGPLDKAADLARDGLAEARAAVGALRGPVGLGVEEIPALVERFPGAATVAVDGTPGELDGEAGHAVYRAVQEALTNAARYAPGAPVTVTLTWTPELLRVSVADTGRPRDREPVASLGSGLGLSGMAERLRPVHGAVRAGPGTDGGWRVEIEVRR